MQLSRESALTIANRNPHPLPTHEPGIKGPPSMNLELEQGPPLPTLSSKGGKGNSLRVWRFMGSKREVPDPLLRVIPGEERESRSQSKELLKRCFVVGLGKEYSPAWPS